MHDDELSTSDAIFIQTPLVKMPPGMQQSYKGSMTGMAGPAVGAAELLYYRACASLMDASAVEEHRSWHEGTDLQSNIFRAIQKLKMPAMTRTVAQDAADDVRGVCLGLTAGPNRSAYIKPMPSGGVDVAKLIGQLLAQHDPNFTYASIQLIINARSQLHVDRANVGPSLALSMGLFIGGELCVHSSNDNTS